MRKIWQLDEQLWFPPATEALTDPNGLLAIGGDLSPERLLLAYRSGIFPWFSEGEPLLWWSPAPRMVLYPDELRISKSLQKRLRNADFRVTFNQAFAEVIQACANTRAQTQGTWITADMQAAYIQLHQLGHAHSVEVWQEDQLVGGLYGVWVHPVFCGESMFARVSDASKVALAHWVRYLHRQGVQMIDCQVYTDHLARLGAREISRETFLAALPNQGTRTPPG